MRIGGAHRIHAQPSILEREVASSRNQRSARVHNVQDRGLQGVDRQRLGTCRVCGGRSCRRQGVVLAQYDGRWQAQGTADLLQQGVLGFRDSSLLRIMGLNGFIWLNLYLFTLKWEEVGLCVQTGPLCLL